MNNNEIQNLSSEHANYLAKTEFPSVTTLKVINVYRVEGSCCSSLSSSQGISLGSVMVA